MRLVALTLVLMAAVGLLAAAGCREGHDRTIIVNQPPPGPTVVTPPGPVVVNPGPPLIIQPPPPIIVQQPPPPIFVHHLPPLVLVDPPKPPVLLPGHVWIPGYHVWDAKHNKFDWVQGSQVIPPKVGAHWIPPLIEPAPQPGTLKFVPGHWHF